MGYKEENISIYDKHASEFDSYFQESFDKIVEPTAKKFAKLVSGKNLLDLGSGSGNHAQFFKSLGFNVTCLDLSKEMLRLCHQKGLPTLQMDLEHLQLAKGSYDAIWSFAALIHVSKEKLPSIVKELYDSLKPGGLVGLGVKEGAGEGYEVSGKFGESKRWFSYYLEDEIREVVKPYFEEIYFTKNAVTNRSTFIYFFLKKISQ